MSSSPVSPVQITVTVTVQLCPHRQCPLYKSLSLAPNLSLYNYVLIASVPCTNHCHWHQTCHCTTMSSSPVSPVQINVIDTKSVTVQLCSHRQCPLYKSLSPTRSLRNYVLIASVPCTNHCHHLGHCATMSSSPVSPVQITVTNSVTAQLCPNHSCHCTTMSSSPVSPVQITIIGTKHVTVQLCPHRQCPLYKSLSPTRSLRNYVLVASVPCTNHCHQLGHCATMSSSPVSPVQITVQLVTAQLCPQTNHCLSLFNYVLIASVPCTNHCQ